MYECLLPLLLIVGIAFLVWNRRRKPTQGRDYVLAQFDSWLDTWVAQGRIAPEAAAVVRRLIAEERRVVATEVAVSAAGHPITPAAAAALAQPIAQTSALVGPPPPPPPLPLGGVLAMRPAPASLPSASQPAGGERLWVALLSLNARRTLLVLGAFMLVLSGLTLVVFNWASFPPLIQIGLLAGVTAAIWGGGAWVARQPGLAQAGVNLQAIAALLVPVIGFALSRPGLLDLAPRPSATLAAGLSLIAYLITTAITRRTFYSLAAAAAGLITLLSALEFVPNQWLPLCAALLLLAYLGLDWRLRGVAPDLARGPRWVAHVAMPVNLLVAFASFYGSGDSAPLAVALWVGALFYALAAPLANRPALSYAGLALAPLALALSLDAVGLSSPWVPASLAMLALAYLGLGAALEGRALLAYARPAYLSGLVGATLALGFVLDIEVARVSLPLLIGFAAYAAWLAQQGRSFSLPDGQRAGITPLALAVGGALAPIWLLALADLLVLTMGQLGLLFLPIGALYLVAARWWPGRLRPAFDRILQVEGALLITGAWLATSLDPATDLLGTGLATAILVAQALVRRRSLWASLALFGAGVLGCQLIIQASPSDPSPVWIGSAVAYAVAYGIGGTLLRRTVQRYWTWPAMGGAALAVLFALALVSTDLVFNPVAALRPYHVLALLALAGLAALLGGLWRRAWAGYGVASLLVAAVLLAAARGFFSGWQPALGDLAYVVCGLTFSFFMLGQGLRRTAMSYALPYELVGYGLLTVAPLLASGDLAHLTITWAALSLLYGLGAWRYRIGWLAAPTLLALDMALLNGAIWRLPTGANAGGLGLLLLAATWLQGLALLAIGRGAVDGAAASSAAGADSPLPNTGHRRLSTVQISFRRQLTLAGYVALAVGGGLALWLGTATEATAAGVALGLAGLAGLIAQVERREAGAWLAFGLLLSGLAALHQALGLSIAWGMAWGVAELLALTLLGWMFDRMVGAQLWRRVTSIGALAAAGAATLVLVAWLPVAGIPPLTFALATLALLLATLSARQRVFGYAYAAGAALVGAALCQLFDWGFSEPQWYVIPAGIYLLILATCLRRFQGRQQASRVIETGAIVMLLGTSLAQALGQGGGGFGYDLLLFVEGLLFIGYGTLLRLRVPFLGGVAFFVAGALSLSIERVPYINPWLLFGGLGLLMVLAYVLLERRAEQLSRMGRNLVATLQAWG